jgi:hypothetical protein
MGILGHSAEKLDYYFASRWFWSLCRGGQGLVAGGELD